jgi:hypothetical protein
MATNLSQKNAYKFTCDICDYNTSNKYDYDKHLATDKHQINYLATDGNNLATKMSQNGQFICSDCNKTYKCRTGLWRHKQKCTNNNIVNSNILEFQDNVKVDMNDPNLIIEILKQNQDFKQLIIDQNKTIMEQNNKLFELCKIAGNNNNNTTNSHNKSFNLNFFLNETCKDALNISDFVKSIKPSLEDLETTGRLGYVEGVSNIILKNLNTLDSNMRPIHCTDIKREVLYVKDNDEWIKEQDEKPVLTKAIKVIANENIKNINEWRKEHPGCTAADSRKNDLYLKIVSNAMSGSSVDETYKNINKIIGNVSKKVQIDR